MNNRNEEIGGNTWKWLQNRLHRKETEILMMEAKGQSLWENSAKIMRVSMCRHCAGCEKDMKKQLPSLYTK